MTAGQRAYEEDVRRQPNYHDGSARVSWAELPGILGAQPDTANLPHHPSGDSGA